MVRKSIKVISYIHVNYYKKVLLPNVFSTGILRYDESAVSFNVPTLYEKLEY